MENIIGIVEEMINTDPLEALHNEVCSNCGEVDICLNHICDPNREDVTVIDDSWYD